MAEGSVFYNLGIPLHIYLLLLLVCLAAIFGLFWFVWRVSPGADEVNLVKRRPVVVEDDEPQRGARRNRDRGARNANRQAESDSEDEDEDEGQPQNNRRNAQVGQAAQRGARRGALGRMRETNVELRRRNPQAGEQAAVAGEEEGNDANEEAPTEYNIKKLGKKKAEKMKMKEEKKLERQAEIEMRAERKKREEEEWQERKRKEAEKEAENKKMEEEEEKRRIEREKQEEEEYNKLKASFAVEGEGYSAETNEQKKSKMAEFAAFVKERKVVPLEDLSAHFLIRTNEVVERIRSLESQGVLSGVIDDRGKYIYITKDELEALAKFIKRRGRISIDEIAAESNRLITFPTREEAA